MRRVCQLTTVHQPLDVRIFHKTAKSLAGGGYDSWVVAPGAVEGELDGVRFVAIGRSRSRVARMLGGAAACLRAAIEVDADAYQFHDPELIPLGLALKRRGKRVVYDVHESHAESVLDRQYLPAPLRPPLSAAVRFRERQADRRLDAIVAATPKIALPFRNARTVLVQNFPLLAELEASQGPPFAERERAAVFVGGVSRARGALEMVRAAGLVEGARVVLVGPFTPPTLQEELAREPGWGAIESTGWLDRADALRTMARARAGLVVFLPFRNHTESQPNKLFEYMAAGLPVVASDFPHWRSLLEDVGCAEFADPCDPAAVAGALRRLLDDPARAEEMGRRGQEAVRSRFHWEAEAQKLLGLYRELLG